MLLELLFDNVIIISSLFLIINLFTFYTLGAILQEYFSFKKHNRMLSISIGFVVWSIFTLVAYTIPILFSLKDVWFKVAGLTKEITLMSIIILYYKSWIPNVREVKRRSLIRVAISILVILLLVVLYFKLESFGFWEGTYYNPHSYETFYVWIEQKVSNFTSVTYKQFIEIVIPIIILIIINTSIFGVIVDQEKSLISILIAAFISSVFIFLESYLGEYSAIFYVIPFLVLTLLFLFEYANKKIPNDNLLTASLISMTTSITVSSWSFLIIFIIGLVIISLSVIKEGEIIETIYRYTITIFTPLIIYSILMFFSTILNNNESLFGTYFVDMIVMILTFSVMIFPLKSLATSNNRRDDLVSFEEKIREKNISLILISSLIIMFLSIIGIIIFIDEPFIKYIISYFNIFSEKSLIGVFIYLLLVIVPTLIIVYLNKVHKYHSILDSIPYITFILNPITLNFLCGIGNWDINWMLVIVPEIIVTILWVGGILLKLIPEKLKI